MRRRRAEKARRADERYHEALRKEGAQRVANVEGAKELYYREGGTPAPAPAWVFAASACDNALLTDEGAVSECSGAAGAPSAFGLTVRLTKMTESPPYAAPGNVYVGEWSVPRCEPQGSSGVLLTFATDWHPSQPEPSAEAWEPCYAEDGAVYYHNTLTGETSWEPPATWAAAPAEPAEEPYADASGEPYSDGGGIVGGEPGGDPSGFQSC